MSMISDFFKDSGYGNYYQGSAKNTSGQWYDPANYGGLKAFDPNKPNDPGSIGPGTYGRASMGNWQTGGGQNSYDANPLSPMPTLPAWATQGTPTRWEELVATGQAPKTNTNIPVPAVAGGMRWHGQAAPSPQSAIPVPAVAGGMRWHGQAAPSPQSAYAYTLADLLRNYYA